MLPDFPMNSQLESRFVLFYHEDNPNVRVVETNEIIPGLAPDTNALPSLVDRPNALAEIIIENESITVQDY